MELARDNLLQLDDVNVILVYWSEGSHGNYETPMANTKILARQITMFMYYLSQLHGVEFHSEKFRNNINMVGFSLGAHVAGFVGKELEGKISRITGLDPAGPYFDTVPPRDRLDYTDAQLVDVIHTNVGSFTYLTAGLGLLKKGAHLLLSRLSNDMDNLQNNQTQDTKTPWFGIQKNIGHLDYYANSGSIQPGCNDELHICDHIRATEYYVNFLEYEVRARKAYEANSSIVRSGRHRLVAFPSNDYADFKSGNSLKRNCPALIASDTIGNEERFEISKKCTIPIDLVSPAEEFRSELQRNYNISLKTRGQRKFYFSTLSHEPYVAEHFVLRGHLADDSKWTSGCKLTMLTRSYFHEHIYSVIEYNSTELLPTNSEDFYGIAMPFVTPVDWRDTYPSPKNIAIHSGTSDAGGVDKSYSVLRSFLPNKLFARIIYRELAGKIEQAFAAFTNLIRTETDDLCRLNFLAVEARPLVSVTSDLSIWFNHDDETLFAKVKTPQELKEHGRYKLRPPLTLSTTKPDAKLRVDSIVVGKQVAFN